jgi:hypothetical protein
MSAGMAMRHQLSIMHHHLFIIHQRQWFTISLHHAITAMGIVMRQLFHTNITMVVDIAMVLTVGIVGMAGVIVVEAVMMATVVAAIGASFLALIDLFKLV